MATKLLGISGSLRKDSVNSKLIRDAARLFGDCEFVEADLDIPLYDGDAEEAHGLPGSVQTLVAQIAESDAILISTPEYNGGITGVLKNALDWVSRSKPSPWAGKPVAIMSAAAGRAGGVRGQTMLRTCMTPFSVRITAAPEVGIASAGSEFDENGHLISERYQASVSRLIEALKADIRG